MDGSTGGAGNWVLTEDVIYPNIRLTVMPVLPGCMSRNRVSVIKFLGISISSTCKTCVLKRFWEWAASGHDHIIYNSEGKEIHSTIDMHTSAAKDSRYICSE